MIPYICAPARDNISFQIMAGPEHCFTEAQQKEIILQYGALRSPLRVRRWFRKQYSDIPNSRIPKARQFERLIKRFRKNGSVEEPKRKGRKMTVMTEENIERVRDLVEVLVHCGDLSADWPQHLHGVEDSEEKVETLCLQAS